ncbi:NAD-glutamate dehydrogenase [Sporichthya sp.]|uniref:NAD-glutamate dehydrogenase n=1 Tax=Sporichthya sp. TaxID=65475 RepID=UPI00182CD38F|nr:NAD-glutamate dehydrogenase [Sporichthya sp.]MBA3744200.1 NAD-glutamate dehydrogenase [Sporichthya sp.]
MTELNAEDWTRLERYYYRHAMATEIAERPKADLDGAIRAHVALAADRPQGTVKVRVYSPTRDADGWSAGGRTVVEIVTDDMPFLVDSVTAAMTQADRDIDLVVHPQIVVRRDITGALLGIGETSGSDRAAPVEDGYPESWMHLEIDQVTPAEMARIEGELRDVLRDVRDAVEDWQRMGEAALRAADDLVGPEGIPGRDTDPDVGEAWELLRWLADNHFTFLGHREYDLLVEDGQDVLAGVPGTGLGIMRSDVLRSPSFDGLTPEARARARDPRPLIITKSTTRSTVHRPGYLDYIGVKKFVDGEVVGERRFVGLFSRAAYTENVARIPVLRRKVDELYELTGFIPNSYSGRDLLEAIETYPRDELFQTPVPQLYKVLLAVLHLKERKQLRLFLRSDEFGRFTSALVYLPRDRYNTENRLKIQEILLAQLDGVSVEYTSRVTESVLARLHFVVRIDPTLPMERRRPMDAALIEAVLVEATRTWRESLHQALEERYDEHEAATLTARYAEAFPAGYRETNSPSAAVDDLTRLEALPPGDGICVRLYEPRGAPQGHRRFSVYRRGPALSLSEMLPVLQHLGVEVTDEQPYRIELAGEEAWIYDFGVRTDELAKPTPGIRAVFEDAFLAARDGRAESDGFNRLVVSTGLTWRQVSVVRAYAKYLRQGGSTFGQEYLEQVVTANCAIARTLALLFEARFDPKLGAADNPERTEVCNALTRDVTEALDQVASLDADRILRAFLALIQATLRTNYWVPRREDEDRQGLAFKVDPHQCPDLPAPRPMFEIWVYSPTVEGVHLRFGPVARGGLRWSDRREDFRTEILGLVKAQMVKNTVIVPVGAKGGFVVKRPPAATGSADGDREGFAAEGVACYRTFIGGLLDVTDNLVAGELVPAPNVVRHDADDAYLVVAADKGTAKFSDIANEISVKREFWLGDAFASGGSVGYDHKAMGITARGAWESVKRHFRERGIDCQSQDFTCVGVGDMSGDVFGNGMLLSEHIRLVAAFDHRHVFLDPDSDAATSYAERARMFALPRSSWADYDVSLISEGGGVHPRSAKSIPISEQVRARLGLAPHPDGSPVTALPPNDLLRAILLAEVDLLWNGGIGTYVKASTESHPEVGDKANDAIRVDGAELRAAAVGEGGNLGFTQRGRIEYALLGSGGAGGRVNTDAIDNSAGVDTSDHEVNIKILLDAAIAAGALAVDERDPLLASMTDEVAALVLQDNYAQNVALANSLAQAPALLHAHTRLMRAMENSGVLDRALEFLPAEKEIAARAAEGKGLTAPELAVLLAYTKIVLNHALLATDLPDSAALARVPVEYFPHPLQKRFADAIGAHPLRREILTTVVVNDLVNDAGITFLHRIGEETAAPEVDIARAYLVARDAFDLEPFRVDVAALDNKIDAEVQTRMRLQARRLAERAARWLLAKRRSPLDIDAEVEFFSAGVTEVLTMVPKMVRGGDADALAAERDTLVEAGVPHELAERSAAMDLAFAALDIVEVSRITGFSRADVAEVYFLVADNLAISELLAAVNALPRDDRWKATARASVREELFAAHASLTADVLAAGDRSATPGQHFAAWRAEAGETVDRASKVFNEITGAESLDLAMASVAMRSFRSLLSSPRG